MTRLTNDMRDQIIRNLITHRFSESEKELDKKQHALGLLVYEDLYSPEVQKAMAALPKGFFSFRDYIYCQFGSDHASIYFGNQKLVAAMHRSYTAKVYESTDLLSAQFLKLKDEEKALKKEKDIACKTAMSILNSVNTVEKLLQAWPECKPFVEVVTSVPKPMLPALPIADINAMLGLQPISEQQAQRGAAA